MKHNRTTSILLAGLATSALLLGAGAAQAHAHLVKADPKEDAKVGSPPKIHLQFSEALEPKLSGVDLMKADGSYLPVDSVVGEKDRKVIEAAPKNPLAAGTYMVMWHAVSKDGHRTNGSYNFTVR